MTPKPTQPEGTQLCVHGNEKHLCCVNIDGQLCSDISQPEGTVPQSAAPQYTLSIACVDGETVYGLSSSDKKHLLNFLQRYDHEGSDACLDKVVDGKVIASFQDGNVYDELGYQAAQPAVPEAQQENPPMDTFKLTLIGDLEFTNSWEGRDWARAFVRFCKANPSIAWDEDTMTGWFANAIMRGFDECSR